jgi:hypothetical protein
MSSSFSVHISEPVWSISLKSSENDQILCGNEASTQTVPGQDLTVLSGFLKVTNEVTLADFW